MAEVGGDAGDHDSFGVAAERVFENAGEFGVPEGDEGCFLLLLSQDVDAFAQSQQTLVDVDAFDEPLAFVPPGLLVARQVDHEQLGLLQHGFVALLLCVLLYVQLQDGVRAGGRQVAIGRVYRSFLKAHLDHCFGLGLALDWQFCKLVDKDSPERVFEHRESLRALAEQIPDIFIVNFIEREGECVGAALFGVHLPEQPRDRLPHKSQILALLALVEHGVGLARAGHAVDQDCRVETRQHVADGLQHRALEQLPVAGRAFEDPLVAENWVVVRRVLRGDDLYLPVVEHADRFAGLRLEQRPNTHKAFELLL